MRSEGQRQSQRQERRVAKALGGSRTPASGAFWHRKGDVRSSRFLAEHKWTSKASFSVTSAIWRKIRREAVMEGRVPLLMVRMESEGTNLVVMDEEDFHDLCRAAYPTDGDAVDA